MAKSRRILSVILSIVMVLSVIPMGMFTTASAAPAEEEAVLETTGIDDGTGKLVVPVVTLTSTPVFRINGSTLVPATDSGLPEITGSYTSQYYSGETPHGYTVTLTSDKVLSGTPSLGCSVPGVSISSPVKSGNSYTWTITNGSASFSVGAVEFTADYTYSYTDRLSGKTCSTQYNAYATSWAENITYGSGIRMKFERTGGTHSNPTTDVVHRILGANTYASWLSTTSGSLSRGYYDFSTNSFVNNGSYGFVNCDKSGGDGYNYYMTAVDENMPAAITYIDRNGGGAPLSNNNLRLSLYNTTSDKFQASYRNQLIVAYSDQSSWNENTTHNSNAGNWIGFDEKTDTTNVNQYQEMSFPFTGNGYDNGKHDTLTEAANNGNIVSAYFVISQGACYYSTSDRNSSAKVGQFLMIQSYDKSDLRGYVEELLATDMYEETSPDLSSGIGINPQGSANTNWYSAGYSDYISALRRAQAIIVKPNTSQNEIDLALSNLETAVDGLEVKEADTTALDAAMADYAQRNPANYTDESWQAVMDAYDAALEVDGYSVFYQNAVNKAADDLAAALNNLKAGAADWSEVEEVLDVFYYEVEPESMDGGKLIYSDASWQAVLDAIADAETAYNNKDSYTVVDQAFITGLARTAGEAIDNLEPAPADYTAYDAQVQRYNDVVLTEKAQIESDLEAAGIDLAALGITNIYTTASWKAIQNNLGIDRTLKYDRQNEVDDFTTALKNGIDKRALINAIYTQVEAAEETAYDLDPDLYTDESWAVLEEALEYEKGLKINQQTQVNAMAQAILDAIDHLEYREADYSEFDALVEQYDALNAAYYTADSYAAVGAAIDNIYNNHYNHTVDEQTVLDTEVAKIQTAIDALVELDADYTDVDAAIARWNNFADKDKYTPASVTAVGDAIGAVVRGKKITKQGEVDAMAAAINTAIDNLVPKTADYTALEAAFATAKEKKNQQISYAAANAGKAYFTTDSYAALTAAIAAVPVTGSAVKKDKTIFEQADVDALTAALNAAIEGLKVNGADFTALEAALATVPAEEDLENEDLYIPETVVPVNVAVLEAEAALASQEDYTIDDQADIDALTAAVIEAVEGLRYQPANYAALIARLAEVPADLTIYTADSVAALNAAIAAIPMENGAVKQDKTVLQQADVDAMYTALDNAIKGLTEDFADYTAVDAAISAANAKTATGYYTDASVADVTTAINNVVRGKYAKDQAVVDAMAAAIKAAEEALVEKDLDLTSYNAVDVPADLTIYTEASVNAYTAAKNAADEFKAANKISKQAQFEALVAEYAAAREALELNAADYTLVDQYIAEANGLTKANYVDFSGVDTAITNVVRDLPGTQQADVDAMAQAIRAAIDALVEKPLDLTSYNAVATTKDPALCTDATVAAYNNAKAAADAYKDDDATNKISNQSEFEKLVKTYKNAAAALAYKDADYTELNALIAFVDEIDPENYENYDEIYWDYIAYFDPDFTKNITEQDDVDAMTAELQSYVDMLIPMGADYSEVEAKKAAANTEIAKNIYTDDSVAALQNAIGAVVYGKAFYEQDDVDAMADAIQTAIDALQLKDADYTALNELVEFVTYLFDNDGIDEDGTEYINFSDLWWDGFSDAYDEAYEFLDSPVVKIDKQALVDAQVAALNYYVEQLTTGDEPIDPPAPVESFEFVGTAWSDEYVEGDACYAYGFQANLPKTKMDDYVECDGTYYEIEASAGRLVGTGSIIRFYSSTTDELLAEFIIVIYGDVDGNAKVDNNDYSTLKQSLSAEISALAGEYKLAANVYGPRATVNMDDANAIGDVVAGLATIDQTTGKIAEN